ncbi:MAG: T9SS type A sorting domain-containing protein [Bacteroidales bacterium]|nr:T9SS type A sorting domain-containing protein [Bacteroidales bacterium]
MRKAILTILTAASALTAQAYDYPYLAFQTSDGTTTTVSVESLKLTISDGQLVATNGDGSTTFTLTELSQMYFTAEATDAIKEVDSKTLDDAEISIYDLQGRLVPASQLKRGIYVVKTSTGTRKISVK